MTPQELHRLWAKRAKAGDCDPLAYHPLSCHLLDVGAVADLLWSRCLPASTRTWFAEQVGLEEADAGQWAVFLASTHDWGKCSPGFQDQVPKATRHGTISTYLLRSALRQPPFNVAESVAVRLARVIGGHHGIIPRADEVRSAELRRTFDIGDGRWGSHRNEVLADLARLLGVPSAPPVRLTNAGAVWLAGFISVADWIGSNQTFFPYAAPGGKVPDDFSPDTYLSLARQHAERAIAALGWAAWPDVTEPRAFTDLFPRIAAPNAMQREVIALAENLQEPFLVIIEAPMGMGKTEAALSLADHASARLGMRGHYLALPTQATSNQMFGRDTAFLQERYPDQIVNTQLLHGHAALSSDLEALKVAGEATLRSFLDALDIAADDPRNPASDAPAGVIAAEWFTHRKRGLLAPFGVGTIDQALLAVLQTKHFFVRLLGLAGKTIVFDEVHAYDAYMSVLLERLLAWLRVLGCSVILLSATLPAARRAALLRAWSGEEEAVAATYPAMTWRAGARGGTISFPAEPRTVRLRWLAANADGEHPGLGASLREALRDGGCAAVICNTVKRAQEIYQALKPYFTPDELRLFHARFPYGMRMDREHEALRRFGKTGEETKRPYRAVLVATQVIEQSLDLDFDLMLTELAPVDLVLQRSGRLHRHDRERPAGLQEPEIWLLAPPEVEGLPAFAKRDTFVYDEHILLRSWLALRAKDTIVIPDEVAALIEEVYGDTSAFSTDSPTALAGVWQETRERLLAKRRQHQALARGGTIASPGEDEDEFLEQEILAFEEENPGIHASLQALTRLGEPNITAIVLTPEEQARLRPDASDAGSRAADLLQHSVSLTHVRIVNALRDECFLPPPWKRSALLRHCRLVLLNEQGEADMGFRVDPDLGVVVD